MAFDVEPHEGPEELAHAKPVTETARIKRLHQMIGPRVTSHFLQDTARIVSR
jgi:hypothetical protein